MNNQSQESLLLEKLLASSPEDVAAFFAGVKAANIQVSSDFNWLGLAQALASNIDESEKWLKISLELYDFIIETVRYSDGDSFSFELNRMSVCVRGLLLYGWNESLYEEVILWARQRLPDMPTLQHDIDCFKQIFIRKLENVSNCEAIAMTRGRRAKKLLNILKVLNEKFTLPNDLMSYLEIWSELP